MSEFVAPLFLSFTGYAVRTRILSFLECQSMSRRTSDLSPQPPHNSIRLSRISA